MAAASAWGRGWRWRSSKAPSSAAAAAGGSSGGGVLSTSTTGTITSASGTTATSGPAPPVREEEEEEEEEEEGCRPSVVTLQPPDPDTEEERARRLERIEALMIARCAIGRRGEIWLSELGVAWVLHLGGRGGGDQEETGRRRTDEFISRQLLYLARTWIMALFEIDKSVSAYSGAAAADEEFLRLVEATLSKMLPFVDAVVGARACLPTGCDYDRRAEPADEKLRALILLRDALCLCVNGERELLLLSAEPLVARLDEAVRDTMEETRIQLAMPSSSWSSWVLTPTRTRSSGGVHLIARSFVSYIRVLWDNYGLVNRILQNAAFLRRSHRQFSAPSPGNEETASSTHLTNLTSEMCRSLEEKLTSKSQSFPDRSLGLLFLINNSQFILQQLWPLGFPMPELAARIQDHVHSYIQVSWAPVLKCLHNHRCFPPRSPPLHKFEAKFQETYAAQRFCKVSDPEMRKRMREAIVERVIPYYTEFFKDSTTSSSTPGITPPQEMKRMLQQLFEG